MHIEIYRFPPPYDRYSSGTRKSGIVRLRPWDVPAHHQDPEEHRLRQVGVTVKKPAGRMAWGLDEMWIEDPHGIELRLIEVPPDHPFGGGSTDRPVPPLPRPPLAEGATGRNGRL